MSAANIEVDLVYAPAALSSIVCVALPGSPYKRINFLPPKYGIFPYYDMSPFALV